MFCSLCKKVENQISTEHRSSPLTMVSCSSGHVLCEDHLSTIQAIFRCQSCFTRIQSIENDANNIPTPNPFLRLLISKNAENSTESSPVESTLPMPVAECEKEAPPVASIKQQKQQRRGGENEIQNSTGESDSLQQNFNINVDSETESLLLSQNHDDGDAMNFAKIPANLKQLDEQDVLSMFNFQNPREVEILKRYFDFYPASSSSSSFLNKKNNNLVVVKEVGDGGKILDRETLPSVNVKRDNSNRNDDAHDDDVDNKKNNGENERRSRQNSSLTSKDSKDHSSEIAAMMMTMGMKSSKEFHRCRRENFHDNDDEVGVGSSVVAISSSTPDFLFQSQSYVAGDGMIDDSETAHFTPSSSSVLDSLTSTAALAIQKIIPTVAHRVKFRSIPTAALTMGCKNNNNNHPPQMEPMSTVVEEEIDSSSLTDEDTEGEERAELSSSSSPSSSVCNKKLPRFPIRCPLTNCDSYSIPSDFCNHITIDHPYIDILKITPGELHTNMMTINHKGNIGMVTCQRMFLVTDKITEMGYGMFENCLPIVLLTSRMSLSKVFGILTTTKSIKPSEATVNATRFNDENLYIWLEGVYKFPIDYTLTLWAHGKDETESTMIKCFSNTVFYMNSPHNPKDVAQRALSLSHLELQKLSNNANNTRISCQIVFH